MNNPATQLTDTTADTNSIEAELLAQLDKQKQSYLNEGFVSAETRIQRLEQLTKLLLENQDDLAAAMSKDFGHRSVHQSQMADFFGTLDTIKHAKKHVRSWMKDEKRKTPFPMGLFGARAKVSYQPKGVIGNIATWNFPVFVALAPVAGILAAGNRCMVKLSEVTPHSSELVQKLFKQYFEDDVVVGITGGPEVGAAFSALPFDHILFTGATSIGKHIMRAAAENLTPVTLELGGKSPVILTDNFDAEEAAYRVVQGKSLNSGQVCISPDYCFVPEAKLETFVKSFCATVEEFFPTFLNNNDYTSVVSPRHYERLSAYIQDAKDKGADVREINPAKENWLDQQGQQKIPMHIIINPSENTKVMQDELFGPVICVKTYKQIDEVIHYINARPRPLALYLFSNDKNQQDDFMARTTSGGVCINDVMQHVGCEDLPFGGIGASGMGSYHGFDGFKTFSHPKPIFKQAKINLMKLGGMIPPYGEKMEKNLQRMLKP